MNKCRNIEKDVKNDLRIYFLFFYFACMCLPWALRAFSSCGKWAELPGSMWDFSSWARDWIHFPCVAIQILKHWTTRKSQEWPENLFLGGMFAFSFPVPPHTPLNLRKQVLRRQYSGLGLRGSKGHMCGPKESGRRGGPGCAGWVVVAVTGVSTHCSLCGRAGLVQPQCSSGNQPAKSTSSTSDHLVKAWFMSIFRSASSEVLGEHACWAAWEKGSLMM